MSANCETPFWKDPTVLLQWPSLRFSGCLENKANAAARAFILLVVFISIIGVFLEDDMLVLLLSIVSIVSIGLYLNGRDKEPIFTIEKFEDAEEEDAKEAFADLPAVTMPTAANPFMNVLVDEVKYNPTRAAAGPIDCPMIQETLDNFYRVQWWADPTDVYGKNQGQRQFYTMPSTSVPSDRKSFQEWLFKIPGKTCKEGNRDACNPGTNGGAIPWLTEPN